MANNPNNRPLTENEQTALNELVGNAAHAVLFITENMLSHDAIDAVSGFRNLLSESGVHDYESQAPSQEHKVHVRVWLGTGDSFPGTASLYRPPTKNGAFRRFWVPGLAEFCTAGDALAVTVESDERGPYLRFFNLSASGATDHVEPGKSRGHRDYVPVDPRSGSAKSGDYKLDPIKVERGTRAHRRLQQDLAMFLARSDIRIMSAESDDLAYDIGWVKDAATFVCEIKSLTIDNEERQLRLALGQVLRYRQFFEPAAGTDRVDAAIVVEHRPSDATWLQLLDEIGIKIAWPGSLDRLLQ